ncbi:MAG: hypothetical protein CRN43_08390, partial [Candidatus Nephrothrix sp. EaCA]
MHPAPAIEREPTDQRLCHGGEASFTVSANAPSCIAAYKWQQRISTTASWTDISNSETSSPGYEGAATHTLTVKNTAAAHDGYQYRCVLTASGTTVPLTSNPAALSAELSVQISSAPSERRVCAGGEASFAATANSGCGIASYQWQQRGKDQTAETDWVNINDSETASPGYRGATAAALIVKNTAAAHDGYQYRCVATLTGGGTVNSHASRLFVNTPAFTVHPSDQSACQGGETSFAATITNPDCISAQWQRREKGKTAETDWADISDSETASPGYEGA